jgi:ABC-type sugar transport system ATPase subunit
MGRALARHPQVFLLDEPLSNLDAKLRTQLRADLKRLHQEVRTTSVYVTHDQVEATTLGERIAVMNKGKLQQVGTPREVYARPANLFVAGFIGSPAMNILPAEAGKPVVGVRPEALRIRRDGADGPALAFLVDVVEPMGHEAVVHGRLRQDGEPTVVARLPAADEPRPGDTLELTYAAGDLHLFDAASGERLEND